jgi:hypothetical protein
MMSTSGFGGSQLDAQSSIRHRARARWLAGALLAASSCAACLVLPATAQAQQHGPATLGAASALPARSSLPGTVLSAYCAHFTAAKISSAVGSTVVVLETKVEKTAFGTTYECIFMGSVGEINISREPGIPASQLATRAKAEARVVAEAPKGVKFTFAPLASFGPTAFSWSYEMNGGKAVGAADNKGTTGFGALLGGSPKTVGGAGTTRIVDDLLTMDLAT